MQAEGGVQAEGVGTRLYPEKSAVLKPGQQALIQAGADVKVVENVDVDNVIAWKKGQFNFDNLNLEEVMRQVSRWYDLEVVYQGKVPDISFEGKMSREMSLSGLLKALKVSNVNFNIEAEGRRVIVTSN